MKQIDVIISFIVPTSCYILLFSHAKFAQHFYNNLFVLVEHHINAAEVRSWYYLLKVPESSHETTTVLAKGWIRFGQEPKTRDVVVYKNQIEHLEQNSRVL